MTTLERQFVEAVRAELRQRRQLIETLLETSCYEIADLADGSSIDDPVAAAAEIVDDVLTSRDAIAAAQKEVQS